MSDHHGEGHYHWHASPWPTFAALGGALLLPLSFILFFHYHIGLGAVVTLGLAVIILLMSFFGWVGETIGSDLEDEGYAPKSMLLYIFSEIFILLAFFATYWVLRLHGTSEDWHALAGDLQIEAPVVLTILILISSVLVHKGNGALEAGDKSTYANMNLAALVLWLVFIAGTVMQYSELMSQGIVMGTSAYTTAFYAVTGIHLSHVIMGVVLFAAAGLQGLKGKTNESMAKATAAFTHFVSVLSIFVLLQVFYW